MFTKLANNWVFRNIKVKICEICGTCSLSHRFHRLHRFLMTTVLRLLPLQGDEFGTMRTQGAALG